MNNIENENITGLVINFSQKNTIYEVQSDIIYIKKYNLTFT